MTWKIKYYSDKVEQEILGLSTGLLARYLRLTDLMVDFGPNLGMPHTRQMDAGLYELRIKSKEGIARIFYCTVLQQTIIMLHSFVKKSRKTPPKELRIAQHRIQEVKNDPQKFES